MKNLNIIFLALTLIASYLGCPDGAFWLFILHMFFSEWPNRLSKAWFGKNEKPVFPEPTEEEKKAKGLRDEKLKKYWKKQAEKAYQEECKKFREHWYGQERLYLDY